MKNPRSIVLCSASKAAFTLAEMLVALALSVILITGMVTFFVNQRIAANAMEQVNDMTQTLRVALDTVSADLRTAGYGAPTYNISTWLTSISGLTNSVSVVQGSGSSADIMYLVGAFDEPNAYVGTASA